MRVLFLLLVLANLGYLAWQSYSRPPDSKTATGPLTIDDRTPPLIMLKELPQPPPPIDTQSQREPALQELPAQDAEAPPAAP